VVSQKPLPKNKHSQKKKHFPGNQTKFDWKVFSVDLKVFLLTGKFFPLTNFSNGKQTHKSLKSGFPETTFWETNMALDKKFLILIPKNKRFLRFRILNENFDINP
jgi:hypothetical protein